MSPAHAAAQAGRLSCLRLLLRHAKVRYVPGAHVRRTTSRLVSPQLFVFASVSKVRDYDGATPVHFAAAKGHIDCLRWVLGPRDGSGWGRIWDNDLRMHIPTTAFSWTSSRRLATKPTTLALR